MEKPSNHIKEILVEISSSYKRLASELGIVLASISKWFMNFAQSSLNALYDSR